MPLGTMICPKGHLKRKTNTGRVYCPVCHNEYVNKNKVKVADQKKLWARLNVSKTRESYHRNKDKNKKNKKAYYQNNKVRLNLLSKLSKQNRHWLLETWQSANYRCHKENHKFFPRYGGRGIEVWYEWRAFAGERSLENSLENKKRFLKFAKYIEDTLGNKPSHQHSLDRIDNNKGYQPGNLKWSLPVEQSNNRCVSKGYRDDVPENSLVSKEGVFLSLKEVSHLTGIDIRVVKDRYALSPDYKKITNVDGLISRRYLYKGNLYAMYELVVISGLPRTVIRNRIQLLGWSIEDAVEKPTVS